MNYNKQYDFYVYRVKYAITELVFLDAEVIPIALTTRLVKTNNVKTLVPLETSLAESMLFAKCLSTELFVSAQTVSEVNRANSANRTNVTKTPIAKPQNSAVQKKLVKIHASNWVLAVSTLSAKS